MRPHRWQPTRLPCPWDSPGKNTGAGCHFLLQCIEVAQSCLTLSDSMDCSLPGSSVHGIFQARVLEWVAIVFAQSCPGLCLPMDCSPWNYLRQNPGVGSRSLLQRIFPTQRSNPGLLHRRQILYHLSHSDGNLTVYFLLCKTEAVGILAPAASKRVVRLNEKLDMIAL